MPLFPTSFLKKIADWRTRLSLTEKTSHIRFGYSAEPLRKQKKFTRLLRILLVILVLAAIRLPTKWMMAVWILILLFNYGMFLVFYPKMIPEKEKHRGSHTAHYYVTAIWRDERQRMTVSKSLYESVSPGDSVRVCLRKSIFGVEY